MCITQLFEVKFLMILSSKTEILNDHKDMYFTRKQKMNRKKVRNYGEKKKSILEYEEEDRLIPQYLFSHPDEDRQEEGIVQDKQDFFFNFSEEQEGKLKNEFFFSKICGDDLLKWKQEMILREKMAKQMLSLMVNIAYDQRVFHFYCVLLPLIGETFENSTSFVARDKLLELAKELIFFDKEANIEGEKELNKIEENYTNLCRDEVYCKNKPMAEDLYRIFEERYFNEYKEYKQCNNDNNEDSEIPLNDTNLKDNYIQNCLGLKKKYETKYEKYKKSKTENHIYNQKNMLKEKREL